MGTSPTVVLQCSRIALDLFWLVREFTTEQSAAVNLTPSELIFGSYLLFGAYWFFAALGSKKPRKRENTRERLVHVLFVVIGSCLLYTNDPRLGVLNRRFLPNEMWIEWLGAVLTLAGALFAIWARYMIGKEWSAEVQIKQGHRLIRTGPYAHIRHPIYTGILLALGGTAMTISEYRAVLGLALFLIGFVRKAKKEESFLAGEFGPAFDEHRRHTGFFLPRFT
jgi:protein-S-isoprenylcysteine O-methyltransferase Ste14